MRKGVLISGYYGAGNTGDEAILSGMVSALKAQGIEDITVLSRNPEETKALHGVNSIHCGRRFSGLVPVFKKMRASRLFILGGGGLLQDHSSRVVPFWLSRVALAFAAGTPVMYYAQGIGPLKTRTARRLVRTISRKVKGITVRDEQSLRVLEELGISGVPVEVTADPALGIRIQSDGAALLKNAGADISPSRLKVGIALRSWEGEEEYLPVLVRCLKGLREKLDLQYIFFPFQYGRDEQVSERVLGSVFQEGDCLVTGKYSPEQVAAMLGEMDGVIAMRLHGVILSVLSFLPCFGMVYDPKVRAFLERAGIGEYSIPVEEIPRREKQLMELLAVWISDREVIRLRLKPLVEEMVALAELNARRARELMEHR